MVATAQYLMFVAGRPAGLLALTTFPWGAIPLFFVPVVIAPHLLVFARLRAERQRVSATRRP